jgi:hypothetical protein
LESLNRVHDPTSIARRAAGRRSLCDDIRCRVRHE